MNIDINVKDKTISFGEIPIGEVFAHDDMIYIKTDTIPFKTGSVDYLCTNETNAIHAETGTHAYFHNIYMVKWLKHAKLTVE